MKKTALFAILGLAAAALLGRQARKPAALDERGFVSGLRLEPGLKLEVATLSLVADAVGESPKIAFGVDWGTTKAVVTVPARAHYALDLSSVRPVLFRSQGDALAAVFPEPRVSAVELDLREKRVIVSAGWGRLAALSGRSLEDSLLSGLREDVLTDASRPRMLEQVRAQARPLLEKLVLDYARPRGFKRARVLFESEISSGEEGIGGLQQLEQPLGRLDS